MSAPYLFSFACVGCRRSFKRPIDSPGTFERVCPSCGATAIQVGRHFKPPKRSNLGQWEKVAFLIGSGFPFHRVYETKAGGRVVPYPRTLKAAREFVSKYRDQAWRRVARPQNNQMQRTKPALVRNRGLRR